MEEKQKQGRRLAYSAALAAVAFSLTLVVAKTWAWFEGGSTAMLSSLIDSSVDSLMSFTNFLAIRYALRPADEDHRYGHGKAEGVAALTQAAFIGGSCVFLLLDALNNLGEARELQAVDLSLGVMVFGMIGAIILTLYQRWVAAHTKSLAVEADSAHYTSDVVLNVGIIASLLLGQRAGWEWLDPVTGILIALWLLWCARVIAAKALNMLLDREVEDHVRQTIKKEILATSGVESMHDLRTRRSGGALLVSFDIEVAPDLSLKEAHEISRQVEERVLDSVQKNFTHAEVMIHIDPRGDIADSRHKRMKDFHAH